MNNLDLIIIWTLAVGVLTSPLLLFLGLYVLRNRSFKRVAREFGLKCEIYGRWLQDQDPGEIRKVRSIIGQYHGKEIKISDTDARPGINWRLILLNILLVSGLPTGARDSMRRSTEFFIDGVEQNKVPYNSSTLMGRSSMKFVRQWLNDM